jgi:hypothetical protein
MKNKILNPAILSLLLLFNLNFFAASAQNYSLIEKENETYKIINPELITDLGSYTRALDKANLSLYRLQNKSFTIKFEGGVIVEVFSAESLLSKNIMIDQTYEYPQDFSSERYESVFSLAENDIIVEIRPVSNAKKTSR